MTAEPGGRGRRRLTATVTDLEVPRQRAFLVGVEFASGRGVSDWPERSGRSLTELALLTDTAGSTPVGEAILKRAKPDPATFIGAGQAREAAREAADLDADVAVFDHDLTPGQQRNLQGLFQCDVVDRVAVILDIFAQHAASREGMIQVELALLRYHLPRLRGKGTALSRLGAGIGTRGPGETKLETDRRRIMSRIAHLERQLKKVRGARAVQRKSRSASRLAMAALVGYANAGKSTLMNALTDADVKVEDRLFSTVDSTIRRCPLPGGGRILLSDTVGFVERLPHQLVEAFGATLSETANADLLIHVVDASHPGAERQMAAVREVLQDIGASAVPELVAFNKADAASEADLGRLEHLFPQGTAVSARYGTGLDGLRELIVSYLARGSSLLELLVPYRNGQVLARLRWDGEVLKEDHLEEGTRVSVRLPSAAAGRYREYEIRA